MLHRETVSHFKIPRQDSAIFLSAAFKVGLQVLLFMVSGLLSKAPKAVSGLFGPPISGLSGSRKVVCLSINVISVLKRVRSIHTWSRE